MNAPAYGIDPYLHDGNRWGVSLAQSAELMLPCLEAAGVRSIYEVGAYAGDLTRLLVAWAAQVGATVGAVDPYPQPALEQLDREHASLELIRESSLEALRHIELPDAVVIDGDHNYHVVTEELRILSERAPGVRLPLLLFHDVSWPHARRDDYYHWDETPEDRRRPMAGDRGGIFPGEPGLLPGGGLPYPRSAEQEGGPRNGVLTAIEDFVAGHERLRLVTVPSWFGLGVVWHTDREEDAALAAILDPWDGHPLIERLEANRVHHLATAETRRHEIWRLQARVARQEAVLRRLLDSSAFAVAERLSRLRDRTGVGAGASVLSREQIRRALEEDG